MADTDPNVLPADNQSLPNGDAKEEKKEFFKVATEPPEWLNREYLEKAFREYENDQSLQVSFQSPFLAFTCSIFCYRFLSYRYCESHVIID